MRWVRGRMRARRGARGAAEAHELFIGAELRPAPDEYGLGASPDAAGVQSGERDLSRRRFVGWGLAGVGAWLLGLFRGPSRAFGAPSTQGATSEEEHESPTAEQHERDNDNDEKDPNEKNPNEKNPNEKDPNEKSPTEKSPTEKPPNDKPPLE